MVAVNMTEKGGPKLTNLEFIVEIMDPKQQQRIRNEISSRDGKIVDYINENRLPYMVISDHPVAEKLQAMSHAQQLQLSRKLPLLLRDAVQNKVKICFSTTFLQKLAMKRSHRTSLTSLSHPLKKSKEDFQNNNSPVNENSVKKNGFILRIRDASREFQPLIKKFDELPVLHTGKDFGLSLFHRADDTLRNRRGDEIRRDHEGDLDNVDVDSQEAITNKAHKVSGHCEICGRRSSNLREHYRTKEHQRNISKPGFYDELDEYMGSYTVAIKCPGRPLLKPKPKPQTTTPSFILEDYAFGDTDFGSLGES